MLSNKEKFLVLMSMFEISNKKQEKLLEILPSFEISKILENREFVDILSTEEYHKIVSNFDIRAFNSALENMENAGIQIVTIFSEQYPKSLINLPDRPLILYAKGNLGLLNERCFGVVGTRMPTNYGRIITERFVGELAQSGLVIVSGLCYGIDEIAHKKTLQVGGKTVAIVGSGFNNIYPPSNTELSKEIAEKGLLLSEYYPSFRAKRYTFPLRNRIIAGVSMGILIPEAGFSSGTLHTKEYASEYGKDIFTVPGQVNSSKSELPNHLLKTAQAYFALNAGDIIEHYGLKKQAKQQKVISLNFDEKCVMDLLEDGERDFDYLAEKSKISINILNSCLTTLEIRGLIRKLPAQTYARV